jgi:uncharacterized membrane protein YphA (DoxX/SURF4 family)
MDVVALIGRVLFVAIFLGSGLNHLTQSAVMAGYAESKKLPAARPMVLISGVWIIVGGLMVLLGVWGDLGALMLAAFVLATAFLFHGFWQEREPMTRQNEMIHFMKDVSLGGAALLVFVLYARFGEDLGLTITDPLF